ncbi:hypothetical protein [Olleya aquimaris]|uniref:DUF4836 family protein n=1 Tax=Olleya aquimaris TaxID=639310 RepID=A0A327RPB7_9FLAO|nr:hypothetical protein [Olleya aquimaris]RAJ17782.1 hypothetical protein LY08_00050 [Olleya aquimaris]
MKQLLCLLLCISSYTFAQNTASKIPSDASIVATIKGENLLQLISMEELNNSFLGSEILKELSRGGNTYSSLEDFGFNLNASAHYFMQVNDSINYNAFVIPLKNVSQFEDLITRSNKEEIVNQNGIKTISGDNSPAIVWDNTTLVVVMGDTNYAYFENEDVSERYGIQTENYGWPETAYEVEAIPAPAAAYEEADEDVEVEIEETVIESAEDYNYEDEEIEETVIESTESYDYDEEEVEETVIESTEGEDYNYDYYDNLNSSYTLKRELAKQWSMLKAKQILMQPESNSILNNKSYVKSLDNKAEATLWVNDFGQLYASFLSNSYYNNMLGMDLASMYANNGLTAKLFMEDDKMMLNTTYTMSDEMASSYKKMTSRKLNKKFLNYVNEDRMIGYLSYSVDTKATLEEYPKLMKSIYGSMPYYGEEASLGIDLFSLLLDEEAVAKVLKGDMLFLLSGISQQEVTYTSYEYNDDYEYIEVEKTKTETLPDFLLMASTEDPSMLTKLINYTRNKEMVTFQNGYYTFKTPQSPLAVHFMIKDGIVFLGTSDLEMRKIVSGNFNAKVSSTHKKMMLNNSYSFFISAKQLASQLPIKEMGIDRSGKLEWFLNTSEDAYMKASKIKGNTLETELVVNIPSTEENALKYMFNIIETFAK